MTRPTSAHRLNVLSWMSPIVAIGVIGFLFTGSTGQTQSPTFTDAKAKELIGAAPSQRTAQQMICTVSSFFSVDANELVGDAIHIEGRGLASCKNDQGFTTEVPVSADLTAKTIGRWTNAGELSFSLNSSAFVIPREIGQLQDSFTVKPYSVDSDKATTLFEGSNHDLIMEMKMSSSTDALQRLLITEMKLKIDETAPTLE